LKRVVPKTPFVLPLAPVQVTFLAELSLFEVPLIPERLFTFRVKIDKSSIAAYLPISERSFINLIFGHDQDSIAPFLLFNCVAYIVVLFALLLYDLICIVCLHRFKNEWIQLISHFNVRQNLKPVKSLC
jgi:hypothetical protein